MTGNTPASGMSEVTAVGPPKTWVLDTFGEPWAALGLAISGRHGKLWGNSSRITRGDVFVIPYFLLSLPAILMLYPWIRKELKARNAYRRHTADLRRERNRRMG